MLRVDEKRALETLPTLLDGHETDGPKLFDYVRRVATAGRPLSQEGQRRLAKIEQIFTGKPPAEGGRRGAKLTSAQEGGAA